MGERTITPAQRAEYTVRLERAREHGRAAERVVTAYLSAATADERAAAYAAVCGAGLESLVSYIAQRLARTVRVIAPTIGAFVRMRAMGADVHTAAVGAQRSQGRDMRYGTGVRTPWGGRALLSDGRMGAPWASPDSPVKADSLVGRARTADAGHAPGSASKRAKHRSALRAPLAENAAIARLDRATTGPGPDAGLSAMLGGLVARYTAAHGRERRNARSDGRAVCAAHGLDWGEVLTRYTR